MTRKNNKTSKKNSANGTQNKNKSSMPKRLNTKKAPDALAYRSRERNMLAQAPGVSNNRVARVKPLRMLQSMKPRVSAAGMAFLKCAFAPPDFSGSDVKGVPDMYSGKSLIKKHRSIGDRVFKNGKDAYFLLLPVPGFAYFYAEVAAGTPILNITTFTGVPYSDNLSLFGPDSETAANIVNKFRYISNHFELIPTTNAMSWTGNIQSFRFPMQIFVRQSGQTVTTTGDLWSVSGMQSLNQSNADQYTGPFNLGCYTAAYNTGNGFSFNPILERVVAVPGVIVVGDFARLSTSTAFTGLDPNFDSVCIKVSGVGNDLNTCIIKTWACVEYQALPGSTVYEYQTFSACDPVALEMYRAIIRELPVGVSFLDNEGFWTRVLSIIRRVSGVGMALPGPYGAVASGVNMATSAIESLML